MANNEKQIIICIGLRRSGSTLQFNIVRELLKFKGRLENIGYLKEPEASEFIKEKWLARDDLPQNYIIKAHKIDIATLREFSGFIKIIHIYRDLRDVFLSCKDKWNIKINEYIPETIELLNYYSKVEKLDITLSQSYEEIYENDHGIKEIADFLEIKVDERNIKKVFNSVSLVSAKKKIQSFTLKDRVIVHLNKFIKLFPKPILSFSKTIGVASFVRKNLPRFIHDEETLLHPDHISKRKGAIGGWKRYLSKEEIYKIENEFKGWMQQREYLR